MKKRIFAALMLMIMVVGFTYSCIAAGSDAPADTTLSIKSTAYDQQTDTLTVVMANNSDKDLLAAALIITDFDENQITFEDFSQVAQTGEIKPGGEVTFSYKAKIKDFRNDGVYPVVDGQIQYIVNDPVIDTTAQGYTPEKIELKDMFNSEPVTAASAVVNFLHQTGFSMLAGNWKCVIMMLISCVLLYLAIVKGFEPLLLIPIAFGMLLTNFPGADMFHEELFANGHVHWDLFNASNNLTPGLIDYLYLGVKLGIYPCLIFMGVGAMTDFAPLIANPKSLLLGAAAQLGIFVTFIAARFLGFTGAEAGSIGIISGADGPTAIFVTTKLAPHLLGPIAVAAYSYMALVPVIQPPIMKALTTKAERQIVMKPLRTVSRTEKIVFPIVVTAFVSLLVPSAGPLVGCLMFGNLVKECGVADRISKTAQNELMNIVTIFLGVSVGATATADTFLSMQTIKIIVMGVVAFGLGTAGGVLLAKFMNLFLKTKINPLIGSAGVSAVPMAARVSQVVGQKENPKNFLLMHAMGPNVAGVIGSAIAAGVLLALFA